MIYDGMLYGNGLSMNLITQLLPLAKSDKWYLFNIDDFLKAFLNNRLSPKEETRIFKIFYQSKDYANMKNFKKIKDILAQYYVAHNSNIEYWLGVDLFNQNKCGYDFSTIKTIFPSLYNIWHEIMIDYLAFLDLNEKIKNFQNSVMLVLARNAHIYTTNFDRLLEGFKPEHLHGTFLKGYNKYEELIFSFINKDSFYYKCIWGWNGVGKLNFIKNIKKIAGYEDYFDFDFFFDKDIIIKNLLIYGMGFQNSGYIEELSANKPKYKQPTVGGIIDEHILIRLNGLQAQGQAEYNICLLF